MPCYHSRPAWECVNSETGEKSIRFKLPSDQREPDYWIECGKCMGCRNRQKEDWATRMVHESKMWDRNCFVTLTYDDEHLPHDGRVSRKHIRNFIKRLQRFCDRPIRYYACAEYGERTGRAHYHIVIFNEDFLSSRYYFDAGAGNYGNKEIEQIWGMGQVTIAPFNEARAYYTAGYVAKKMGDEAQDTFALQSRNPPLGKPWFEKHWKSLVNVKGVVITGQKKTIPKVYVKWMEGKPGYEAIKEAIQDQMKVLDDKKLRAKKANHVAKQNLRSFKI